MGNCCAKQGNPLDVLRDLAPAPRPHSSDSVLSERVIRTGLGKVADELHAKGKQITIVGVGGVISTLLLKSRPQTQDVDFFYKTKLKNEDVSTVVYAAKKASETANLDETWLNNHTAIFMQEDNIGSIYEEAIAQNVVIYEKDGLKVVAAPWRYAIATKLRRLSSIVTAKDVGDAVEFLHQHILRHGENPVHFTEIQAWFKEFKFNEQFLAAARKVNEAYLEKYGKDGIVF